ncbi:MAG: hypothetical protein K2H86_09070 [Muribaculaceae bacterium]|nr:hypothetical protein [Muribaculaceae bacterium]
MSMYPEDISAMDGRWSAGEYFKDLTARNRMCQRHGFRYHTVSDLQGFADILGDTSLQSDKAMVCVSDTSEGALDLANTPHITQVKTVFMAMRHSITDRDRMRRREECLVIMREIFRQFMSVFTKEKEMISLGGLYVDDKIRFSEMSRYFFSGCACVYFQIRITRWCSLEYRDDEWD